MTSQTTQKTKRQRGRPPINDNTDRRQALLLAAINEFGKSGFDGASLSQISGSVNADIGLISYYFGSKEQLWQTAIDHIAKLFKNGLIKVLNEQHASATECLKETIRWFISISAQWPQVSRIIVFEGNTNNPRCSYLSSQLVRPCYDIVTRLLDDAQNEGLITDISPRTLFFMITHGGSFPMALPALTNSLPGGDINAQKNLDAHCESIIQLIFNQTL